MTNPKHPGRPVQEWTVVLPLTHHRFASMQRHAHPQRFDPTPLLGEQGSLRIDRCRNRSRGSGKRGLYRIPHGLEENAAVGPNGRTQQREVALDGGAHRLTITLPERGTLLDLGEEEGDRARRQVSHPPSPASAITCPLPALERPPAGGSPR